MTDQVVETPFSEGTPEVPAAPVTPAAASETPVAPVQDPVPAQFQIPEVVQDLVGEGKKYSTPEAALQSIPHAQHHIEQLEQEMASLREDLTNRKAVEEVLAEINKTPTETEAQPQLTQEQLDALIDNRLTVKQQLEQTKSNMDTVKETFLSHFGDADKSFEAYTGKAAELGMSVEQLNQLAATSPKAVFEMFGLEKQTQSTVTKVSTNVNSEAVVNTNVQQAPAKSVMGGSTVRDDIAAWRASAPTE